MSAVVVLRLDDANLSVPNSRYYLAYVRGINDWYVQISQEERTKKKERIKKKEEREKIRKKKEIRKKRSKKRRKKKKENKE